MSSNVWGISGYALLCFEGAKNDGALSASGPMRKGGGGGGGGGGGRLSALGPMRKAGGEGREEVDPFILKTDNR